MATLSFVLAALLSFGETTARLVPRDLERAHVIDEARVGVHRMTRELRNAHLVNEAGAYRIDVDVLVQGASARVRYQCDEPHPTETTYRRCYRFVVAADGSTGAGQLVVDRILSLGGSSPTAPVFSHVTNASGKVTYVEVRIEVPARGDLRAGHGHRIALHDGFYMRNVDA